MSISDIRDAVFLSRLAELGYPRCFEQFQKYIEKSFEELCAEREALYKKYANLVISTTGKELKKIAQEILDNIKTQDISF